MKRPTHNLILPIFFVAFLAVPSGALAGPVTASSIGEFSDVQGQDGWEYGYMSAVLPFSTSSMIYTPSQQNGLPAWLWSVEPTYPQIGENFVHPGTAGVSAGLWAVRRWSSDIKSPIRIDGTIFKGDPRCGDGILGRILHNGAEIYEQIVQFNDATGFDFSIETTVEIGDTIDFVVEPRLSGFCDSTVYFVTIYQELGVLLRDLTDFLDSLDLQQSVLNSLNAKLNIALQALDDFNQNNNIAAINALGAFINAVIAQRGKKISEEDADTLIAEAHVIIDQLS